MDRRLHQRVAVQFEARVTTSKNPDGFRTIVSDISPSGVCLALPIQFAPGEPVRVEMADSTLSGNVIYSNPESSSFRTGIEVKQVELGSTDLSHLLQRTLTEILPETAGLEPIEAQLD